MRSNLKLHTSFVSPITLRKYVDNLYLPVFIVRSISNSKLIGPWHKSALHCQNLSPSTNLFRDYRDNGIDFTEYGRRYIIELIEGTDIQDQIKRFEYLAELSGARGVIMLGYGSDATKCHRSILSDVMNESGLLEHRVTEIVL